MLTRRDFLKLVGAGAGAVVLNGCGTRGLDPADAADAPITPALPGGTPLGPSRTPTSTVTSLPTRVRPPTDTPTATGTPWTFSLPTQSPTPKNMTASGRDKRRLCFVLWDHQLARYDFKPRNPKVPLPETVPLLSGATCPMTPAWEDYWRGILRACNPGMSKSDFEASWKGLTADARAFTNGKSPDSGDFAMHALSCGGATHEMVTGKAEGGYVRIYTLNTRKPPPPIPHSPNEIDMTRHFFATSGNTEQLPDGSYAVYGFPMFENCIVPLVSTSDTDLIELSRIKVVHKIQRPYNTWPTTCDEAHNCLPTKEG